VQSDPEVIRAYLGTESDRTRSTIKDPIAAMKPGAAS